MTVVSKTEISPEINPTEPGIEPDIFDTGRNFTVIQGEKTETDETYPKIVNIRHKYDEEPDDDGNILSRYRVELENGQILGLNFYDPPKEKRVTDSPIIEVPAWWTGLRGFNEESQKLYASLGFPSLTLGWPGEERRNWLIEVVNAARNPNMHIDEIRKASLKRQASHFLDLLSKINDYLPDSQQIDNKNVFSVGFSRGAMTQPGFMEEGREDSINVYFALNIAACFEEEVPYTKLVEEGKSQLPHEIANIGFLLLSNFIKRRGLPINTVNLSPKSIIYELAHWESLRRGDAGKLAQKVPLDQEMGVFSYGNDVAGQYKNWKRRYQNHPNVHVGRFPGSHLSIAAERTHDFVNSVFSRISKVLRSDPEINPAFIDYDEVLRSGFS